MQCQPLIVGHPRIMSPACMMIVRHAPSVNDLLALAGFVVRLPLHGPAMCHSGNLELLLARVVVLRGEEYDH